MHHPATYPVPPVTSTLSVMVFNSQIIAEIGSPLQARGEARIPLRLVAELPQEARNRGVDRLGVSQVGGVGGARNAHQRPGSGQPRGERLGQGHLDGAVLLSVDYE